MTIMDLTMALYFVKNGFTIVEVNIREDYVLLYPNRLRKYSIKKLAHNYDDILRGREPTYYSELY